MTALFSYQIKENGEVVSYTVYATPKGLVTEENI